MWNCPQCGGKFTAGARECPACGVDVSALVPAPVSADAESRARRDKLLSRARTAPNLYGPPLLYPGESVLLEVPVDPKALARRVWTNARPGLLVITVLFGIMALVFLGPATADRWLLLGLVASGLIIVWAGMAAWTWAIARDIPPRIYLTDHRLILWNPTIAPRKSGRMVSLADLLGVQVLPQPDGTVMLRLFRQPDGSSPTMADVNRQLVQHGRIGGDVDMRPMLVLGMYGPGPAPADPRLMNSGGVLWMKSIPEVSARMLVTALQTRVPTAIVSF